MVDQVRKRLRGKAVESLEEIKELLNREHGPTIDEIRTRVNELIAALNPEAVTATAGAQTDFLEVTIGGVEYAIPLHARS